ncbi:MAG: VIT domain-containing protein [Patescibacteria group bacterium]
MSRKKRKGGGAKKLPLSTLKAKARLALDSPALVEIAGSANSPNEGYELAYLETGDVKLSIACQNLAKFKRDYGKAGFDAFVSSVVSNRPQPKRQPGKSKGAKVMGKGTATQEKPAPAESMAGPMIPLEKIDFRAAVNGAFARVKAIQRYGNKADHPVEAVYVFPLPDEATVIGCKMKIGRKTVVAELKKRQEARRAYDEAVAAGHHGALMEQERPNIFTMNVGGIEPGESISVEVDYIQSIFWQAGGGRFTIPLVVGPQFIPGNPTGKASGGWAPDTDEVPDASRITPIVDPKGVPYTADIKVSFSPGFRCALSSPSHEFIVSEQTVAKSQTLEIKTGLIRTDRDFILVYRSLAKVAEVAAFSWETADERFCLVNILPPGEVPIAAKDVALVLDCSGSMAGEKIAGLMVVAKKVIAKLKEQNAGDRVGIIPFDTEPWPVHPLNPIGESTSAFIDRLYARGGTMIGSALNKAVEMLCGAKNPVILLVTDGESEDGRNWSFSGIRLIGVGIGAAANDTLIKDLARRNNGVAEFVYPGEDHSALADRLAGFMSGPVLREVKVAGGEAFGVTDVFQGRPAKIAVRLKKDAAPIVVSGKDPDGTAAAWQINAAKMKPCDFAAQIWAREFIREHQDRDEQTAVSLKYGVICRHTSFIAISLKEVPGQKPERVEIPVELPHGWEMEEGWGGGSMKKMFVGSLFVGDISLGVAGGTRYCASAGGSLGGGRLRGGPLGRQPRPVRPKGQPIGPTTPVTPSQPPALTRFTLDAPDSADQIVAILIAASEGRLEEAKQALAKFKISKSWDEETKAKVYYFALRLRSYGLNLFSQPQSILIVNKPKNKVALLWWTLTQREIGLPTIVALGDLMQAVDGQEYLLWKSGSGPKPTIEPWSLVP